MKEKDAINTFAENLRVIRARRLMTQKDFADFLGIQNSTLSSYESGTKFPSMGIALSICDKLDVSMDWLLGRKKNDDGIENILNTLANAMKKFNNRFRYIENGKIEVNNLYLQKFFERIQKTLNLYNDGLLDEDMLEACTEKAIAETLGSLEKEGWE